MGSRLDLHAILVGVLGSGNVYFQPPSNHKMEYPCIRYERSTDVMKSADNNPYFRSKKYQLIVIDKDPDSLIPDKVALLSQCRFNTHYEKDGLHHDVFTIAY